MIEDAAELPDPFPEVATRPPAPRESAGAAAAHARGRGVPGPVKRHPAATAIGISIAVHVVLIVGGYFALRSLHLFVPARLESPRGDGSVETGVIDHAGDTDLTAGAEGTGAPKIGWSGFHAGPGGAPADPGFDPAGFRAPPPPPPAAPPPEPRRELIEADDAPPLPVIDEPDPLDPDSWPVFPPKPSRPPDAPPADTPAPPADAPAAPAPADAPPADEPPAPAPAGTGAAGPSGPPGAGGGAAGYSSSTADPGGLLRRDGAGGSGGAGGATTGNHGAAVTGRPGIRGGAPRPVYPALCQQLGEQGRVVLDIEVLADGRVGSIRVVSDSGHRRLADAAIDAVRDAPFYPALWDGRPVRSVMRYPFVFELR